MYSFLFDKRSLVLLLAGTAVAGGALFFAGLLVGVQWGLPFDTAPVTAPARPVTRRAAFQPAERPCKPVPEAATVSPQPAPAVPDFFPQEKPSRALSEPPPKPMPVRPAPQPPAPVPAPAPVVTVAAVTPAPEPEQPKASPEPAAGPGRYSLQVGAFRDARNSEKVIQDLQAKGYEPYVIEQKGRSILLTVRIGRYADRAEALRAASELRRREGLEAIVRPI